VNKADAGDLPVNVDESGRVQVTSASTSPAAVITGSIEPVASTVNAQVIGADLDEELLFELELL